MIVSDELTRQEEDNLHLLTEKYSLRELALNKDQELFLENELASKKWRMNNLYTIRDKDGTEMILKLNKAQQLTIYNYRHNRKVILKSRQQGISTLFLAYYLDDCLFKPGFQAGIQSYGIDEAVKLQKRAELMWEKLDPAVKELLNLELVSNNSKGMTFNNGSILKIGNFRGDTLQGLHVSELGKIAKKYPEKAKELKTGAFQAVGKKNKITVESTAEGQSGLFFDIWMRATNKRDRGKRLTPLDFQPIFLPWFDDPDCQLVDNVDMTPEAEKYLEELPDDITIGPLYLNWLIVQLDELGEDFNQEYPATPEMAFAQSVEGAYFHRQYRRILDDERIGFFPHVPGYEVHTAWDLGINDEMVITFAQVVDGKPRIINVYHNTSYGFDHYIDILFALKDKHGYEYGWTILPHDIEVRELSSGMTRQQLLRKKGITRIRLLKKIKFGDSIQVARTFLDMVSINESTAEHVLLSVQMYRKKYDKTIQAYMNTDVHDIHSNYMASLRYLAQGLGLKALTTKDKRGPLSVKLPRRAYQGPTTRSQSFAV